MSLYFTCHWQNRYWNPDSNADGEPVTASGSNKFSERGVAGGRGHVVYVVTISARHLYLGGRMRVSRLASRDEAAKATGSDRLYPAEEWVIDATGGTPLHLQRRLAPEVTKRITCVMASGEERGLCFVDRDNLDPQATRGVRELTEGSARLLDRIIEVTDAMPRTGRLVTVTNAMLGDTATRCA